MLRVLMVVLLSAGYAWGAEHYIDAPGFCHTVERIEGDRVFLRSPDGCALEGPGKIKVALPDDMDSVRIFVDGREWKTQKLVIINITENTPVDDVISRITLPDADPAEIERLRKLTLKNPEWLNQLNESISRVVDVAVPKHLQEHYFQQSDKGGAATAVFAPGERLYVFISSSMPDSLTRTYVAAAADLGPSVRLVLRGMLDGPEKKMNNTVKYAYRMLVRDPSCPITQTCDLYPVEIIIDPTLYTRFQIEKVPAFVFSWGTELFDSDHTEGDPANLKNEGEHVKLYGDVSVLTALLELNRVVASPSLTKAIETLEKGHYQ